MSTINNQTITQGITLGTSGNYVSPLTITSTGAVKVSNDYGIYNSFSSPAGTVVNQGTIEASKTGVILRSGGYVNNDGGLIASTGTYIGVYIRNAGTVTNTGTIIGAGPNAGIRLSQSGLVNNNAGLITAYDGVYIDFQAAGTVINAATIIGTGSGNSFGVEMMAGGTIINNGLMSGRTGAFMAGPGMITNVGTIIGSGALGIQLFAQGTVINSGTISGSSVAIGFYGNGSNRLILESGYKLFGSVKGNGSAGTTNTLELRGGAGIGFVVNYDSLGLTNFQNVVFGGGDATLQVAKTTGTVAVTFSGFDTATEIIDLTGIGTNGQITNNDTVNHRVTITGSLGSVTLQLDASDATAFSTASDGASGTQLAACFCRGTMILTEHGEVPVEELAVGNRVKTLSGALKPIIWIGIGRDLVTSRHSLARPIIVRRGALADNVPSRDLYLTHGHALYLSDVLVPVENLINHRSILWDEAASVVEYYHVELDDHDIVLAAGAAAETYYDAGNRALFHNTQLGSQAGRGKPTYAPVLNGGEVVDRVWTHLFERAGGQVDWDTTDDPDLHLRVNGARIDAAAIEGCTYTFMLVTPATSIHLRSHLGVPSLLGITAHDHRRLGVAISRIELRAGGVHTVIEHDAPVLREGGCHAPETDYCWTDGNLELRARLFSHLAGPVTITVHIERPGMRYPRLRPATLAA